MAMRSRQPRRKKRGRGHGLAPIAEAAVFLYDGCCHVLSERDKGIHLACESSERLALPAEPSKSLCHMEAWAGEQIGARW